MAGGVLYLKIEDMDKTMTDAWAREANVTTLLSLGEIRRLYRPVEAPAYTVGETIAYFLAKERVQVSQSGRTSPSRIRGSEPPGRIAASEESPLPGHHQSADLHVSSFPLGVKCRDDPSAALVFPSVRKMRCSICCCVPLPFSYPSWSVWPSLRPRTPSLLRLSAWWVCLGARTLFVSPDSFLSTCADGYGEQLDAKPVSQADQAAGQWKQGQGGQESQLGQSAQAEHPPDQPQRDRARRD
jgi:hypothetical protein